MKAKWRASSRLRRLRTSASTGSPTTARSCWYRSGWPSPAPARTRRTARRGRRGAANSLRPSCASSPRSARGRPPGRDLVAGEGAGVGVLLGGPADREVVQLAVVDVRLQVHVVVDREGRGRREVARQVVLDQGDELDRGALPSVSRPASARSQSSRTPRPSAVRRGIARGAASAAGNVRRRRSGPCSGPPVVPPSCPSGRPGRSAWWCSPSRRWRSPGSGELVRHAGSSASSGPPASTFAIQSRWCGGSRR